MITKIENNDFSKVNEAAVAAVDFNATWCGPCKMLAPIFDELSEELTDIEFFSVDVDENPELAMKYGVQTIPNVVILKKGELVDRMIGFNPKEAIKQWMTEKSK